MGDGRSNGAWVFPGFDSSGALQTPTPVYELPSFLAGDNELFVKREDAIPFSFGGNKARIAQSFFLDAQRRGCDAIIAYGSSRSNLARVIANGAAYAGIPCTIVSPYEDDGSRPGSFNSLICEHLGAHVHACEKACVAQAVEDVVCELRACGLRPYYIYGDKFGRGNEAVPVQAYASAYREIADWEAVAGQVFDYVFLATGTGMTQAGLLCGAALAGRARTIVGISVARSAEAAREHIARYCDAYLASQVVDERVPAEDICVCDGYLHGGYGCSDEDERRAIARVFARSGMPLDETYVGKGFDGMLRYVEEQGIRGKRILFLHTGGAPLFFDSLVMSTGEARS